MHDNTQRVNPCLFKVAPWFLSIAAPNIHGCVLNLPRKEDYDYTANHLSHYGQVCRVNRLYVKAIHRTNAGGAVADRTGTTLSRQ